MEPSEDPFWEALRRARDAAELRDDELLPQDPNNEEVLAEAEALLQELDAEAEDEDARDGPSGRTSPSANALTTTRPRPTIWHRPIQLAATVLLAPKFLLAASAATAVAVTAMVLQNTTRSLPFQDAVRILMDEQAPAAQREAAQGRVYFSCIESIQSIQDAAASSNQISDPAASALQRIRAELDQPSPFSSTPFSVPLGDLIAQLANPALDREQRTGSLRAVTGQAIYGLRALQAIAQSDGPAGLKQSNSAQLQRIAQLVAR